MVLTTSQPAKVACEWRMSVIVVKAHRRCNHTARFGFYREEPASWEYARHIVIEFLLSPRIEIHQSHQGKESTVVACLVSPYEVPIRNLGIDRTFKPGFRPHHP